MRTGESDSRRVAMSANWKDVGAAEVRSQLVGGNQQP